LAAAAGESEPAGRNSLLPLLITSSYLGEATYQDNSWKIAERVTFSPTALTNLRDALNRGVADLQINAIAKQIYKLLGPGWRVDNHDLNRWVFFPPHGDGPVNPRVAPLLAEISRKGWSVQRASTTIVLIRDRSHDLSQRNANDILFQAISRQGWKAREVLGGGLEFTHSRDEVFAVRRYPVSTTRRLAIVLPKGFKGLYGRDVSFEPDADSKLILTGPSHLILSTSPEGNRQKGAGKDTVEITLGPTTGGGVDIQILSSLFRTGIGSTLASMSISGFIKWLVVLGAAVSADELKRLMLIVLRWIQKRVHIPIPEKPTGE
jgi:hypothetical protein